MVKFFQQARPGMVALECVDGFINPINATEFSRNPPGEKKLWENLWEDI